MNEDGYWNMHCWGGLSEAQQDRLVTVGNLPFGFRPEGECPNPAELEVTTMYDLAPGARFYCIPCAIKYLEELHETRP